MKIRFANRQKDLEVTSQAVKSLVQELLFFLKKSCDELGIFLVSEKKISQLHAEFFGDSSPTDCISFPIDEKYLGDIFVSPSAAIAYAKKKKEDPYEETALYIVHGLLHLIGFDDLEEKERRRMRKKEKSCMRHLNKRGISLHPK